MERILVGRQMLVRRTRAPARPAFPKTSPDSPESRAESRGREARRNITKREQEQHSYDKCFAKYL